jgi:hypothetical protein
MITIANPDADDRDYRAYGRMLRELAHYCAMPSLAGQIGGYTVSIWRAGVKRWRYIATAANYRAADNIMRAHIRRRYRRRARKYIPPLFIRCSYCDYIRRRTSASDDICADCYFNIGVEPYSPDDDPGFDPLFLL